MIRYGRFLGLFTPRSARAKLRAPKLEGAESLERRSMLSATFDTGTGVLTLVGTESNDVIALNVVKQNGSIVTGSVKVRGVAGVAKDTVFANVNSVVISTLGGNDRVAVASGLRNASGGLLAVTVDAGRGNDVVSGGDGDDTIIGGLGRDVLKGGRGGDSVDGGDDDDKVSGDDGDDVLLGGSGRDDVRGGRGDDSVYGNLGSDKLFGEDGDDDLDGGVGDDDLFGGRGNDDDVDDDDSLKDMSRRGDDSGDNENDDEDENEDDDDDDGDFDDDDEGEDDDDGDDDDDDGGADDDDDPVGTPITFSDGNAGTASLNGTSTSKLNKVYYSFTIAAASTLQVTMQDVDSGRYADFEIERQGSGAEVEYELEPSEGGPTSGTFSLPAGTYSIRLQSPDLVAVTYAVDLLLAPVT